MEPLGATVHPDGTRFVVQSSVAERIELCLFEDVGAESDRIDLVETGGDWSTDVGGVGPGQRYGFRVHGPGDPANGHACDPAKLLIDPAARLVVGDLRWTADLTKPGVDSAALVPRSVVCAPGQASRAANPTSWERTVAYEAHVGHLTARHSLVAEADRGRYAGLRSPVVIDHLQRLGVTAVSLLPVQQSTSEQPLVASGRRNVWGYNPLAWGAPHSGYATSDTDPADELQASVAALHDVGLEVWLDVVFNHTCEGSLGSGPILSWRGFDNVATYRLLPGVDGLVDDDVTGCGNAIDTRSPAMRRLIVQMLARWVDEFGIDGFRFDLAATLIRGEDGPDPAHQWLADVAAEPSLDGVKLVAEPWDTGGYALGAFPEPWREWNDRFRNDVQDLWRGAPVGWPAVATRLTGSADAFGHGEEPERAATAGINAAATHDGFSLADLVSYETSTDGGHHQRSSNSGVEGPATDPAVLALRRRRQRAMLGTVLCAQGVPMIGSGDELGRSQGGRADGYTLEPAEWGLAWADGDWDLAAWTAAAIALRHREPALRRDHWLRPGDPEVRWFTADGTEHHDGTWTAPDEPALQVLLAPPESGGTEVLILMAPAGATFTLPDGNWQIALDATEDRPSVRGLDESPVGPALHLEAPAFAILLQAP